MRYAAAHCIHIGGILKQLVIRRFHRWLGIVAAVQLLIWTGSGLFFAVMPIETIRGSHLLESPAIFRLGHVSLVSPSSLVRHHKELSTVSLSQIQIAQRLNTPIYVVKTDKDWLIFDAETAAKLAPLTETEARAIASNNTSLAVKAMTWVATVNPGSEYREGELPAWRVELEGADHASLWIGANSGQVRAVRTTTWRVYDFLWGLHIMDYYGRDNFNSWLLRGFALLGVTTILSGIVLTISSIRRQKGSFFTR